MKIIKNKISARKKGGILFVLLSFVACFATAMLISLNSNSALAATFGGVDIEESYTLNTELALPVDTITVGGNTYDTTPILRFPDKTVVSSDKAVLSKVGEYELVYRAVIGGKTYEKSYAFKVDNKLYTCVGDKASAAYETRTYENTSGQNVELEGVAVNLTNGASFKYNKIIDVSGLTKDDELIKFYILPERIGAMDVNQIRVKLTDIYNTDNYVTITARTNTDRVVNSNATVNASVGQVPTGLEMSDPSPLYTNIIWNGNNYRLHANSQYGSYFDGRVSFAGTPHYGDITTNCVSYYFDYSTKAVYHQAGIIADLDDISMFSKPWGGFTTGEVYLSIEGVQFNNTSATIMITNINGEDLTEDVLVDSNPPSVSIDLGGYTENTLPCGVLNNKYALFGAEAFDKEGEVELQTKVYYNYNTESQTQIYIADGGFVPNKIGVYTIEYRAKDASGNETIKTLSIKVIVDSAPLTISLGDDYSASGVVGEAIKVKGYTVKNNKGNANVSVRAELVNGDVSLPIDQDTFTFTPIYSGTYKVIYEFSDYVYNKSMQYEVTIGTTDKPYLNCDSVVLPDFIMKNSTYVFPVAVAYDYGSGSTQKSQVSLMVYNDGGSDGTYYADPGSVKITATNSVKLRYYAVNKSQISNPANVDFSDTRYVTYKDFDLPVIDAGMGTKGLDMSKLFYTDGGFTASAGNDGISFIPTTKAISDGKGVIRFVNDIHLHRFALKLTVGKKQFTPFSINIYDAETKTKQLSFAYSYSAGKVKFSLNSGNALMVANAGEEFNLSIDVEEMTAIFYNATKVSMDKTCNGESIQSILGRKVFFTVESDVADESSSLVISKVCNQVLSDSKKDLSSPIISSIKSSGWLLLGDEYEISPVYAYDVINPNVTFTLKVVHENEGVVSDMDGNLLNNADPTVTRKLSLDHYGLYTLIYTASDGNGSSNTVTRTTIEVIDVDPPQIALGSAVRQYSVGDTVTIATATASDTVSEVTEINAYYIAPNGQIVSIKDNKFKASFRGKYSIYYYVMDEQGNIAFANYEINVR